MMVEMTKLHKRRKRDETYSHRAGEEAGELSEEADEDELLSSEDDDEDAEAEDDYRGRSGYGDDADVYEHRFAGRGRGRQRRRQQLPEEKRAQTSGPGAEALLQQLARSVTQLSDEVCALRRDFGHLRGDHERLVARLDASYATLYPGPIHHHHPPTPPSPAPLVARPPPPHAVQPPHPEQWRQEANLWSSPLARSFGIGDAAPAFAGTMSASPLSTTPSSAELPSIAWTQRLITSTASSVSMLADFSHELSVLHSSSTETAGQVWADMCQAVPAMRHYVLSESLSLQFVPFLSCLPRPADERRLKRERVHVLYRMPFVLSFSSYHGESTFAYVNDAFLRLSGYSRVHAPRPLETTHARREVNDETGGACGSERTQVLLVPTEGSSDLLCFIDERPTARDKPDCARLPAPAAARRTTTARANPNPDPLRPVRHSTPPPSKKGIAFLLCSGVFIVVM